MPIRTSPVLIMATALLSGCASVSPHIPDSIKALPDAVRELPENFKKSFGLTEPVVAPEARNILFDSNQAELREDQTEILNGFVDFLVAHPNFDAVLEGHTDSRSSDEYNLALAEQRAKAVQDYLSTNGVESSRTMIVSYGESRPAAPNQSEAGQQENRRVSISVIERAGPPPKPMTTGVPKNQYNGTDPAIPGREAQKRPTHR